MPVLIGWYQRRFFRIEENKIKDDLTKKVINLLDETLGEKVKQIEKKMDENFNEYTEKSNGKFAKLQAMIFHAQTQILMNSGSYASATESLLESLKWYIKCDDALNLRRALSTFERCLKKVTGSDITTLEGRGYKIDELIKSVKAKHNDGSFHDLIQDIQDGLKEARNRTNPNS